MTDKILVMSTASTEVEADHIAAHLIELHLAACVTVLPAARSIYRWKGEVERTTECMLMIKSRRELLARLTEELRNVHSYQVPEVIALAIVDGSADYLEWLDRETQT